MHFNARFENRYLKLDRFKLRSDVNPRSERDLKQLFEEQICLKN